MSGYLLSIELRRGDSIEGTAGEIVLLQQAWCGNVSDILTELDGPTGGRFREALAAAFERGIVGYARGRRMNIESDPRRSHEPA